jgi:hypothetical protein
MTSVVSPISPQISRPYLTLDEYKNAPTALDYGNLVQGGTQAQQDAELTNAITRASSWIDQYCNQVLVSTLDVEQQRVRLSTDGTIRIHPQYHPIVSLNALNIGSYPGQSTAVTDLSSAWIEDQSIIIPISSAQLNMSSQGSLGLGFANGPRGVIYANYTYINGYPLSLIGTASSAGATSLILDSGLGITAGQTLKIYDGASSENIVVASTYTYGSNTIPLTSPALYAHAVGVSVSALPAAVKEACILITSAYLKIRGDASLTLDVTTRPGQQLPGAQQFGNDMAHAQEILKTFRRMR